MRAGLAGPRGDVCGPERTGGGESGRRAGAAAGERRGSAGPVTLRVGRLGARGMPGAAGGGGGCQGPLPRAVGSLGLAACWGRAPRAGPGPAGSGGRRRCFPRRRLASAGAGVAKVGAGGEVKPSRGAPCVLGVAPFLWGRD